MPVNKPIIIGLTGGIGCGKSEAARHLASLGAVHLDADGISRSLTAPNGEALPEIRRLFGDEVFNEDGTMNRRRMAEIVFADEPSRRLLEGIIHPLVQRTMMNRLDEAAREGAKVVILDVPLLFETGMDAMCDECWVVYADYETQVQRVMDRDHCTSDQAKARIESQMSSEDRCARATRTINTDRNIERTRNELTFLYNNILKRMD